MSKQISVIVPIYNVEKYLGRCIESILKQTYQNLQIILVNDGSTDGSAKICDSYAKRDSRIVVLHKSNGGLVSARKAGIQAAAGEYVGYVDGDDWIEPTLYETMVKGMVSNQADMVETQYFLQADEQERYAEGRIPYGLYCAEELIPSMLCDKAFHPCRVQPYLWSKLFKRELLLKHQLKVDERIVCGEDIAVVYPYILDCKDVCFLNYAGYHYMQRKDSLTGMTGKEEFTQNTALIRYLRTIFSQNEKYAPVMLKQLNQYAKAMLLVRNIDFFDLYSDEIVSPFEKISLCEKIAIYGAGRMGKNVYRYFTKKGVRIAAWTDKEYAFYKQLDLPVCSLQEAVSLQTQYDKMIIAVSSKGIAEDIKAVLCENGLHPDKIVWLAEDFIDEKNDILRFF